MGKAKVVAKGVAGVMEPALEKLFVKEADDVAAKAAREGAEEVVEKAGKEAAEKATKKAGKEATEEATEGAARKTAKSLDDGLPGKAADARSLTKDPIDVATGEVLFAQTDVTLPGVLSLVIERVHVSSYRQGGLFGISWASTLDQRLELSADGVRYAAPDGTIRTYPHAYSPGTALLATAGPVRPLTWLGNDGYLIEDPRTGQRLHFPADSTVHNSRLPITAISDRNGNTITFDYDETGTLTRLRHSGGYQIAVDTDGPPGRERVTGLRLLTPGDGEGILLIRYGHDADGNLTEVINSSGRPLRFGYDDTGRMTGWEDRNGHEYRFDYDEYGRAVRGYGSDGYLNTSLSYRPDDDRTVVTDSLGHRTTYFLNDRRQVIAETNPLGHTTRSEWDERDRLLSRTDPLGRTTRYTYDERGNITTVIRPDGTRISVVYNALGLPTEVTEPDGAVWRQTYDRRGNRLTARDPAGATTVYGYDQRGHVTSVRDALGNVTRFQTDGAGLVVTVTDPLGNVNSYRRDPFGRTSLITDPLGGATRIGWTIEGRPAWRTLPDGATERWNHDAEGNLVEHVDAVGQSTRFEYTCFDLPAAQIGPDGARLEFGHDTELRLTTVTNPLGLHWRYDYDPAGNLAQETDFNDRVLRYSYDQAGRLTRRINGAGEVTEYIRDAFDNVIERRSGNHVTRHGYDAAGRLTRAIDANVDLAFHYDALGRVVAETCNGRTVNSAYDALGRQIRRRTASGVESVWTYDAAGRPAGLTTGGQTLRFGYDPAGREVRRHIGAGAVLDQQYDAAHQLVSQSLWGISAATGPAAGRPGAPPGVAVRQAEPRLLQQRTYTWRQDGSVTAVGDRRNGDRTFDLDRTGRVNAVTAHDWSERYAYDTAGNITDTALPNLQDQDDAVASTAGRRSYSGTLIRQAGRTFYEHDAQGRLVRRRHRTLSGQTREWAYTWDAEDRLTAVTTPDGQRWLYQYDPIGRRVSKQRLGAEPHAVVERTDFTWDGPFLVEQTQTGIYRSSPAVKTTTWNYEPGTFEPLAQTEHVALAENSQQWFDQRFYAIVSDLIGTPMEMVNPVGNVAHQSPGMLWGNKISERPGAAYCPLRFPGQYFDPESHLHYNFFRYYDPASGRYSAPDPVGLRGGWDPHRYVENPQTWIDPLGLKGELKYVTYTKTHPETGKVYTGRSRGYGTPEQIVAERDAGHHMTEKGFGPAVLDKSATATKDVAARHGDQAYQAIRGREQQLIDHFGGAQSFGGTSGNAIRGIAADNPLLDTYMNAAKGMFG